MISLVNRFALEAMIIGGTAGRPGKERETGTQGMLTQYKRTEIIVHDNRL
jgi:hypothetical protein